MATAKRVRLDPDTILTAALAVADEAGLEGMSMRRLAERIGADPTAVYRHFRSKEVLVVAMADRLFASVADCVPTDVGWRERAEALMKTARDLYRVQPRLVDVLASLADETESLLRINEISIGCLVEAGVPDREVGLFLELITVYVVGTGVLNALWDGAGDDWRGETRRFYGSRVLPGAYPHATALAAHLYPPNDEVFDFAVGLLLDAVERSGGGSGDASRHDGKSPT